MLNALPLAEYLSERAASPNSDRIAVSHALGRASVGLHTEMYFANNPTDEDAFVLSIDKSKLSVIIPRFGIEGTVRMVLSLCSLYARPLVTEYGFV